MRVLISIMKIKINKTVLKVVKNKKYSLDMKVNCRSKILLIVKTIPKNKANLCILVTIIIIIFILNIKYLFVEKSNNSINNNDSIQKD